MKKLACGAGRYRRRDKVGIVGILVCLIEKFNVLEKKNFPFWMERPCSAACLPPPLGDRTPSSIYRPSNREFCRFEEEGGESLPLIEPGIWLIDRGGKIISSLLGNAIF